MFIDPLLPVEFVTFGSIIGRSFRGPWGPHGDPFLERRNRFGGKLSRWRHLEVFITNRRNQKAFAGFPGHQGGARISSRQDTLSRVEPQSSFQPFRLPAMTLIAVIRQYRSNFFFKKASCSADGSAAINDRPVSVSRWAATTAKKNRRFHIGLGRERGIWLQALYLLLGTK